MKHTFFIIALLFGAGNTTTAQTQLQDLGTPKNKAYRQPKSSAKPVPKAAAAYTGENPCFPLIKDKQYNIYDFILQVDDSRVVSRYKPFFDKHHLKFSGYVWEVVLKEMLLDANIDIAGYIVLRSESDRVMIKATRRQSVDPFAEYICHVFSNLVKFDSYLKRIDKSKVPNY